MAYDQGTQKMLKYDLEGHLLYSWGTVADLQGSLWGIHGISTDQEGNLYTAGVNSGRFNKFTPRRRRQPGVHGGQAGLLRLAAVDLRSALERFRSVRLQADRGKAG